MTKFQFIKTKLQVAEELHKLWDQYPLYKFINGAQWIRQRELEIAESVVDAETWIELCRNVWQNRQLELENNKKRKPR
jgi:hypothetical protein